MPEHFRFGQNRKTSESMVTNHSNYHKVFICLREKEQAELTARRYLGASQRLMSHYYP
jgi:hypothetical protein